MSESRTTVWHVNAPNACMGGLLSRVTYYFQPAMTHHIKARCDIYPGKVEIQRYPVPNEKVPWEVDFPEYKPEKYTSDHVLNEPVWADKDVEKWTDKKTPLWNCLDGKINRKSHKGVYRIDPTCGCPLNPMGRTGLVGRGNLGRWGPNHAADPIVTRWKRDANGEKVTKDGKPILQFIAVQRKDNGQWAIPGGMVDAGEVISITIKREFGEEALNTLEASAEEKKQIEEHINSLFSKGKEVYRGYVDDPRNTDNAWMETIAINFHDSSGESVGRFKLNAGDDAVGVKWMDLSRELELYASHKDFLEETAKKLNAYW